MTEYTKIMEVKYSSAVKMGGIYQNPFVEFSLNSPPEQPEKREEWSLDHRMIKSLKETNPAGIKAIVVFLRWSSTY